MAGWDDSIFSNLPRVKRGVKRVGADLAFGATHPFTALGDAIFGGMAAAPEAAERAVAYGAGKLGVPNPEGLGRDVRAMIESPTFGGGMSPLHHLPETLLAAAPIAATARGAVRSAEEIARGSQAATEADRAAQAARAAQASPGQAALDAMTGAAPGVGHNQGPPMPAPPSATDIATGRRAMTDVPDIRGLPVDQALTIARDDPHLIVAGRGSPGYYVGGPASIKSPEDLAAMRAKLDAQIQAGMKGADWYDRARAGEQRATGGDPATNDFMAQAHGTWSQGVTPESETAFAMKEIAARAAGRPQRAMYQSQSDAFNAAIDANNPQLAQTGKKTGQYATQVNANQPRPEGATGVNDFRMGQEMGFKNADATEREGEFSLSPSQHTFMDYETAQAVARANAANLGGRSNWTGPQIQASPWTIQKAGALMKQRPGLSLEDAFAEANKVPQDFYPKHAANITYEQQPARMLAETGHTPTAGSMTDQQKLDYANDPRASFASAPSVGLEPGELPRDLLYGGPGARIGGSDMGYPVLPTRTGTGLFKNKLGEIEANPMFIARPLTGFDAAASLPADIAQTIKEARAAKGVPATGPFSLFHGDQVLPLGQKTSGSDIKAAIAKAGPLDPSKPLSLASNLTHDLGTWEGFDPKGTTTIAGTPAGNKVMLPASKDFFETGEEARAYVLAQEGIGGHKLWFNPTPGATNGYFMPLNRNATPEEMDALSQAGDKFGLPHVTSTAGGLLATNFDKSPTLTVAHRKAIPGALASAAPEGAGPAEGVRVDPFYAGPAWGGVGAGTATDQLLARLKGPSGPFFANNPDIGRVAGGVAQRDKDYASVIGGQRDDIWNARNIMAADPEHEGQTWADRLAKYRKQALPASIAVGGVATTLYPTAGLPSPLPPQQPGTTLNSAPDWQRQLQEQRFSGYY